MSRYKTAVLFRYPDFADPLADPAPQAAAPSAQIVTVKTDVLTLSIDTFGGDVVEADLNQYAKEFDSADPFELLKNSQGQTFIAQSTLWVLRVST